MVSLPPLSSHAADELLERTLREESAAAERTLAWVRGTLVTGGVLILIAIGPNWLVGVSRWKLSVLGVLVLGYIWTAWWLLTRRPYRYAMSDFLAAADVAFVAILGSFFATRSEELATPELLGMTPLTIVLLLIITMAGVRLRPRSAVIAAIFGIVAQAGVLLMSLWRADLSRLPSWVTVFATPPVWVFRAILFACGGTMATLVAMRSRAVVFRGGRELIEQLRVRQVLETFVDPGIAEDVLKTAHGKAEIRDLSVMFTDLRDFTELSERLSPSDLMDLLNQHYRAIIPVVHRHGGSVNKFLGDAIMATFGAPVALADHADRAVKAAREMHEEMKALNRELAGRGLQGLSMGVAIASGPAVVGLLGAPGRLEYAVLGDTVNTASRVEGLNRRLGTTILLTAATVRALKETVPLRDLGEHPIRGKRQSVQLFTC